MSPRTPDLDELLRNAGWLRRLAAGLVGPQAADDLVQDTWVQAMRTPPREGTPPGPWLARVARNLFRMGARKGAVRQRYGAEIAAEASGETAPNPEELLVRLETQRRLARIVAELDEPFRTTVLLRYFEGLSGARIARATGVPAGTVRWRLKEGLDRIRAALSDGDGDAGGDDGKRWRLALIPLVRGAWIMKKTWSIVAIILVLLGLGASGVYLARRGGGRGASEATAGRSEGASEPARLPAPPAARPRAPAVPGAASPLPLIPARVVVDPNATAGAFSGRVVNWSTGQGVAGAQVTFNTRGAAVTVAADKDGRFTFEPQAPGRYGLQLVTADGYLPFAPAWDASPISLEARPGLRIEGLLVYLSPALDYVATVVDPDGHPVRKASGRLVNAQRGEQTLERLADEFTADDNGQFVFHAPDFALVEARHPDWAPGRAVLDGSVQTTHKMTIRLGPPGSADAKQGKASIRGRVVDGRGDPIAEALVTAVIDEELDEKPDVEESSHHPRADDVTDEEGRFALAALDPGRHRVTARADGYAPTFTTGDTGEPLTIVLSTGASLAGRVVDAEGNPVPAFTLHVQHVETGGIETSITDRSIIDPDGRFELHDLVPGPAFLAVAASGLAPASRIAVDIPAPPAAGGPVEVRLPRGGRVTGRVTDRATHEPLEYARVSVEGSIGDGSSAIPFAASTTTAADGTFELGGLAPGRRSVFVGAFAHHPRIIGGLDVTDGGLLGPLDIDLAATAEGEQPQLELVGIGVQLEPAADAMLINKVFPGGGAADAGLDAGDQILSIDGVTVASVGFQDAIALIRGPEGTTVVLTLRRVSPSAPTTVTVARRRLHL